MKKVHIWLGQVQKEEEDYFEYFNQEDGSSEFSKDIGTEEEYDEDFIGMLPLFEQELPILQILEDEVPIDEEDIPKALQRCNELSMEFANAVFYLSDSSVVISEPYKNSYNGLIYIGLYNSSL
ncbi:immunity 22 family protein [Pedobacter caeni]|uniref:Immunity protein 22 n=1 Tax=Pedobacter caeni TaxID=288992 RepID=A0A1M5JQV7_9SPHI|nr:immunity 22 family protein [Pedobacter caeni]SHG42966.1 Immunity protein 22 [Pedobacter caeni]